MRPTSPAPRGASPGLRGRPTPKRTPHRGRAEATTAAASSLTRDSPYGGLYSDPPVSRSLTHLPHVSTHRRKAHDGHVARSVSKCPALPAAFAVPQIPLPGPPRRLAEAPGASSSTTWQTPPSSPARSTEGSHYLSASRRLQLLPESVAVVTFASPTSSASAFPNNAFLSLTNEPSWLEQARLNAQPTSPVVLHPQPPALPRSPVRKARAQRQPTLQASLSHSLQSERVLNICSPGVEPAVARQQTGEDIMVPRGEEEGKDAYDGESGVQSDEEERSNSNTPPSGPRSVLSRNYTDFFAKSPPTTALLRPSQPQQIPSHRARTRQGSRSVQMEDLSSGAGFTEAAEAPTPHAHAAAAEGADTPAYTPDHHHSHHHPAQHQQTPLCLRDLSDAPSKVGLTSSMRLLRAFLEQHPPHATPTKAAMASAGVTSDDNTAAATTSIITFSEAEKKEIERLIADLQVFVSSEDPPSPTAATPAPTHLKTTSRSAATPAGLKQAALPPQPSSPPAAAVVARATSVRRPTVAELTLLHATPIEPIVGLTSPLPPNATAAMAARASRSIEVNDATAKSLTEPKTVEGRYREALKSIEDAAGDCQLALQRVQDYSESLFILVQTWMHLHDNRFDEFAKAVLQRLLDRNPSYRVLFHRVNVPRQALVIMDMIGRAVVAFTRPADLMDIMGEMGARHNLYGLTEAHFMSMRDCFLEVYAEFVGPETFAKSVSVWRMFWKTTIELAVSGAATERGKFYARRRYRTWAARISKAVKELLPLQCSGGFHRAMQLGYSLARAKHPELAKYEQMLDMRTAHRCMEVFLRIIKYVVQAESAPPVGYNDQFSVEHIFSNLTEPITREDMEKIEESFLDACASYLEPVKAWDDVVRVSMRELWSTYITGYWTAQPEQLSGSIMQNSTAPDGKEPFCLMFTDIEASTRLWDQDTKTMGTAITNHHQLIRGLIEDFGGYEVKTVGDSFLIATRTVTQALLIAFGIQLELMAGPSAPSFHMVDNPQGLGAAACWRDDALRVRVGINYCTDATAVYDSVHNRFDYYGPSVNCAARVEAAACGGQVLLSHDAYEHLQEEDAYARNPLSSLFAEQLGKLARAQAARGVSDVSKELAWVAASAEKDKVAKSASPALHGGVVEAAAAGRVNARGDLLTLQSLTTATDEGLHPLKGIAQPVELYSLLPLGLTDRAFPDGRMQNLLVMERSAGSSFSMELSTSLPPSFLSEDVVMEGPTVVATDYSMM